MLPNFSHRLTNGGRQINKKGMNKLIKFTENAVFDFDIKVSDMFGKPFELAFDEQQSSGDKYIFTNKNNIYELETVLEVVRGENYAYLQVDCELKTKSGYDRRYILNAYDTVTVTLNPKNDTDKVFGSTFYEGEKCDCWATAFHCGSLNKIAERPSSLVWKYDDTYFHMLPLCDGAYKSEIKNIGNHLCITSSPYCSGYAAVRCKSVIVSWGTDPYKTAENTVDKGFEVLGLRNASTKNTRLGNLFDYLGWCSWDSMGLKVNSKGLYEKAQEFLDKKIPVKWFLIDDGWFPVNDLRQMLDFHEVKEQFPEGLRTVVSNLKNTYGLDYVGIWECLSGGWRGIAPESRIAKEMQDIVIKLPNGMVFPKIDEEGSFSFWNKRHDYLSRCGFDFVKVDVECNIETCTHGYESVGKAAKGTHYGMEGSIGLYFDGACINCTGMGQESLWNRPVGMVNRNSADFLPGRVQTMNKFVNDNIYNSFYHSYFSATDWDMMWSSGSETAPMNTVLHAICGGPVYLSDPQNISDANVIMPFCQSDGKLLKCDHFAQPTEDRLFRNPRIEAIFAKAWNFSGNCGVLGVFNTNDGEIEIKDSFSINDIKYIDGEKFLLYNWKNKNAVICKKDDIHTAALKPYDAELYLAAPFKNGVAVLGNIDKYISPACIESETVTGGIHNIVLYEGGLFAFAAESDTEVYVNGHKTEITDCGTYKTVDCTGNKKTIIQIVVK